MDKALKNLVASGFLAASLGTSAHALQITPDVILADAPAGLAATVNMSVLGNVLTITLQNNSVAGSATGANGLLTGIAFSLPTAYSINSGMALIGAGSTVANQGNPIPGGNNISGEWGYQNSVSGHYNGLAVNRQVSTMEADTAVKFSNTPIDKPDVLGGPDFGLVSKVGDPGGLTAIADSGVFVLNLSESVAAGNIDAFLQAIEDGIVALTFGSPSGSGPSTGVPDGGSSMLLLGMGMATLGWYSRRRSVTK